jgi:TP901 family phage tail tape measure protein
MADESIGVSLTANTTSFVKGFNDAAQAVGHLGKAAQGIKGAVSGAITAEMQRARNAAIAVGAAFVATGLRVRSSLSAFVQLETNMQNVATVADQSGLSIGKMSEQVRRLAISGKVTQDVNKLSEGLYNIVSSGFQGAEAMHLLEVSAKAASAGLTSTITAGTGITQILNAYGLSASKATEISDIMFNTVNVGVTNFEQLASSIGHWASVTAAVGVPVGEATAAIAAMTKAGSDTFIASTSLRSIMVALINPSKEMAALFGKLGVASGEALIKQYGFAGSIQKIMEVSGGSAASLQGLFQDVNALNGVLQLTGPQAGFFAQQAKLMSDGLGVAGETTRALKEQQKTLSAQWAMFTNQMTEMRIQLGLLLAPLAKAVVGFGTNFVGAINNLPGPIRQMVAALSLVTPALAVLSGAWLIHIARAALMAKAITGLIAPLKALQIVMKFPILGRGLDALANLAQKGIIRSVVSGLINIVRQSDTVAKGLMKVGTTGLVAAASITAFIVVVKTLMDAYNDTNEAGQKLAETIALGATAADATGYKTLENSISNVRSGIQGAMHDFDGIGGKLKAFYGGAIQSINPFDKDTVGRDIAYKENLVEIGNALQRAENAAERYKIGNETVQASMDRLISANAKGVISLNSVIAVYDEYINMVTRVLGGEKLSPEEKERYLDLERQIHMTADQLAAFGIEEKKTEAVAKSASAAQQQLGEDIMVLGNNASEAKDKASAYADMLQQLQDKSMGTRNAQAAAGDALRGFIQDISDLKEAGVKIDDAIFDPFTEGGAKLQGSLSNISGAMAEWANQVYRTTGDAAQANNALLGMAGGFIEVAKQSGFSSEQIKTMLTLMGLTPETVQTIVQVPGADAAIAKLLTVDSTLNSLDGKVVNAYVVVQVRAAGPPDPRTGEFPTTTQRAAGPPDPRTGLYPPVTTGAAGEPTIQQQIKAITDQVMQGINAGVLGAGTGFKPKTGGGGGGSKAETTKLTPQEAAAYAYQAGFRGENLVRIVAIMGRESGYNPKAFNPNTGTGDLSYGLTQLNMIGGMGPQRRAMFGIGANEELFDPLTNLRAAFQLSGGGTDLSAWGGYKGMSDTYNTDMAGAQAAVEAFFRNEGNFGGLEGGITGFVEMMAQHAMEGVLGNAAQTAQEASLTARKSVIENMAGLYSRVGQGIINEAIETGEDPTDKFNEVADSFAELTQRIGKDTAVQLLYYAGNAEEYTAMAAEIIHQNDLMMSKEDYMFSKAQINADDYKKILEERLTHVEQYSSEWVSLMNQIEQVEEDAAAAQDKLRAKERKRVEDQFRMNEMSREDYIKYLAELITHYDKYSDQYMEIWGILHDLNEETKQANKDLTESLKDAWQQAYDNIADPIKQATSLVGAFGTSMDVTSESIREFYGHMKEATTRWVDAIGKLKASGIDQGFLADLVKQGPQGLTLAETIVGMGAEGIGFINSSIGDINQMTQQFGTGMLPAGTIGSMIDNSTMITVGDVTISAPGNVGISQAQLVDLVNQALAEVVTAIKAGQKANA